MVRGRFRGGNLVTCHPFFWDMTLQSQILVTESLLLTSVSKFIRKYFLSRHFSNMYSSYSNPATSLVIMYYYWYLISVHCREIKLNFFEKVRRCATAYGMFYACKCSLDLAIAYRKNIQSPAVTRCRIPGIFCHQIQKRRD